MLDMVDVLEFVVVPSMESPEGKLDEKESPNRNGGKVLANNEVGAGGKLVSCSFFSRSSGFA
jgi:hypothetical protein